MMIRCWVPGAADRLQLHVMQRVLFISSTGGHLSELLKLQPLFAEYDFTLVTENTSSTNPRLKEQFEDRVHYLLFGTRVKPFQYVLKLFVNTVHSFIIFCRRRPKFIVSTGAHTAGPMCVIGHIFGAKIIFIETAASVHTPSETGRIVYRIADLFIVQHEEMLEVFPRAVYRGALLP